VKAYFWTGHRNFGDLLTPLLMSQLAGIEVSWSPPADAELIAVGSIANHIPRGWSGIVYGAGKPRQNEKIDLSKATVLALRGALTAAGSGAKGDYVLGDPGLLVSLLPDITVSDTIPLGVVPHWEDRNLVDHFPGHPIDVQGDPLEVIRQIAACKRIVSSSLHGIIVADAFGKERRWERSTRQKPFKFADHGTVVDRFLPSQWGRANPVKVKAAQKALMAALSRLQWQQVAA
jgi:pyruvyltransferase